ncbi:MAG: NAD(P)H-binding protein, partial [Acidobacteria bacterium]|nr:NAD(P)H-binding protein [Acidobacteriota bacterium]
LRRPVGVPLGILLVIIAMAAYLIWPRLPFHTNVQGSRVMIAVLPFDNLSGDSEQEYLPDGLTEEMISQLGRLNPDSLGVIARQSSMQQKHSKKTLREIGKDLSVDYIVNGSVRLSKGDPGNPNDDRVRITANLSQVSSNSQIWSQSYDRMLSDVLDVQSEVAQAIADEIRVKLTPQQRARLAVPRPVNPDAYRAYLKGRYYLNQRALDGLERGIGFFEQAAAIDPNYALASVGIADTYNLLGFYSGLPPKVAYPKAKEAAQKALALDSSLAEAHAALADVRLNYDYDWKGAEAGFRRAIELNPNYAVAHHWYGVMLAISGRSADAGVELQHALQLDPVSLAVSCDMALQALYAREFDKSIEQSRKCLELDPAYHMGHAWLGRGYLEKKMYPEAIAEFKKAISLQPANLMALAFLGNAYARSGQPALARKVIRDLQTLSRRHYVAPALIAIVYAGLGENDRVFEWAGRAADEHDPLLTRLNIDPIVVRPALPRPPPPRRPPTLTLLRSSFFVFRFSLFEFRPLSVFICVHRRFQILSPSPMYNAPASMPAEVHHPRAQRLFITGASGFLGRCLLARLDPANFQEITCLTRSALAIAPAGIDWVRGNLADTTTYSAALSGADCVIHLAAATGKLPPREYFSVNLDGTRRLVEQCKQTGVRNFLFVSSIAAGFPGQSRYYYAQSKVQAEEIVRASGLRHAIVRPTMIFGRGSPVLAGLAKLAALPVIPVFGNGRTPVQPIAVENLADFILRIVDNDLFRGETFDLGGPDVVSIEELLRKIHLLLRHSNPKTLHIPMSLLLPALTLLEIVAYPLLPITIGQLATFRFDGTARPNALWSERKPHLQSLEKMLAAALAP